MRQLPSFSNAFSFSRTIFLAFSSSLMDTVTYETHNITHEKCQFTNVVRVRDDDSAREISLTSSSLSLLACIFSSSVASRHRASSGVITILSKRRPRMIVSPTRQRVCVCVSPRSCPRSTAAETMVCVCVCGVIQILRKGVFSRVFFLLGGTL